MKGFVIGLLAVALAGSVAAEQRAPGVTIAEAQTLPVKALARRVLGDVGAALVVDVDRPTWGPEPSRLLPPPKTSWPPPEPPPMSELVFYTQPMADMAFGLCEETVITVSMSATSPAVPTEVTSEKRFGQVGSPNPPQGFWTDEYAARLEKKCAAQPASRAYFPASDRNVANDAARITEALAMAGSRSTPPSYAFRCSDRRAPCRFTYRALHDLDVRRITDVHEIPCSTAVKHWARHPSCYSIEYSTGIEGGQRVLELRSQTIVVAADLESHVTRILDVRYDEGVASP